MLPVQTGLFENQAIGNVRQKMDELYYNNPDTTAIQSTNVMLFLSSLFVFLFGLISEQIANLRFTLSSKSIYLESTDYLSTENRSIYVELPANSYKTHGLFIRFSLILLVIITPIYA